MNRNDGAVGDARKRAAATDEWHDTRCEREYTDNGFIFIDCLCGLRKAKADAWDEGYGSAEYMAKCWGHIDSWEDEPTNPYRAEATR